MICPIKYVFQIKQDFNVGVFNMIIGINESKTYKNVCENDYVWKPAKCNCEIGKYLASIKDDSAICDKVIESYVERKKFN